MQTVMHPTTLPFNPSPSMPTFTVATDSRDPDISVSNRIAENQRVSRHVEVHEMGPYEGGGAGRGGRQAARSHDRGRGSVCVMPAVVLCTVASDSRDPDMLVPNRIVEKHRSTRWADGAVGDTTRPAPTTRRTRPRSTARCGCLRRNANSAPLALPRPAPRHRGTAGVGIDVAI